jgi:hypothetical protein
MSFEAVKHPQNFFRKLFAVIFMAVAVVLCLFSYTQNISKKILFLKWTEQIHFSFRPSFLSTLMAILIYASIVIRRRKLIFKNVYDTVITVLNILFCASFLSIFFGDKAWNIPLINISSQTIVYIAILASWICMSAIAGFIWMFLFIIAIPRIAAGNIAMGLYGVVYILSAFLSLGFQADNVGDAFSLLKSDFFSAAKHVAKDVDASVSSAKSAFKKW